MMVIIKSNAESTDVTSIRFLPSNSSQLTLSDIIICRAVTYMLEKEAFKDPCTSPVTILGQIRMCKVFLRSGNDCFRSYDY